MVKEIFDGISVIEVPLPDSPLRSLNSYFIRGEGRSLLIDTGFNRPECREALAAGLLECGADMGRTDIFLTHFHADHSGLCQSIAGEGSRIYISGRDLGLLERSMDQGYWDAAHSWMRSFGVPEAVLESNQKQNPAIIYRTRGNRGYCGVEEGLVLAVGPYRLRVVATPGHTPGHVCLFEEERGILFSGDHILFGITPNISAWEGVEDSLGDYMDSLRKVGRLEPRTTLAAHREPGGDCAARVGALLRHHEGRLEEALQVVRESPGATVYRIASRMTWSIRAASWEDFPPAQTWFATAEAASHLDCLHGRGLVRRLSVDGVTAYEPV